jgi:replicative DNA helicase
MDNYNQSYAFRKKIIALLLDARWLNIYGTHLIIPEYFDTDHEQAIVQAILSYHSSYRDAPKDIADIMELVDDEDCYDEAEKLVVELLDGVGDLRLSSDVVKAFAKEQAMKIAILDSVDDITKGDIAAAVAKVTDASKVGDVLLAPGIDLVQDIDKWLYDLWANKVRTGWLQVDQILDGGLSGGVGTAEMGVIMAPPNQGKSMGLVNVGYNAASIGSGLNVVHFTHELSAPVVAKRYAARMVFKFVKSADDKEEYKADFLDAAKKLMPGKIRVIGGSRKMRVGEMASHIDRLISEGFQPGLIIDDYADLLVPERARSQKRFELSDIYTDMRAMAGQYGVPIWTATQSTRGSLNKEVITMADIAEDIGKAAIADVIIALCQTPEEHRMDRCRLYMAKVRDGAKQAMIDAKYYGLSQAIVSTGFTRRKDEDEDV